MRTSAVVCAASFVWLCFACSTKEDAARSRAANDFKCPEDQVSVTNAEGTSYRATGCGQTATYACTATGPESKVTCLKKSGSGSPRSSEAETEKGE